MIIDHDLDFLKDAVALVDANLDRLEKRISTHRDPTMFGFFDQVEYITGLGFVACQTYATAKRSQRTLLKEEALSIGPKHRTGLPMIMLVNAAANYWKHNLEWSLDVPKKPTQRAVSVISDLGVNPKSPYPITNTLREVLAPYPARFENLIPFLTQWRDGLSA